jgi:hypothetical protein
MANKRAMVESRQAPESSNFLRRLGKNIRQDLSWLIAPFWTWTGVLLLSPTIYLLGVTAMYGKNHIPAVVFYFIGVAYILAKSLSHTKTEARKAFKAFAIVLFFAGILVASLYWDWYIFRTDSQAPYIISGITDWLWLRLLSVWALPKKWIAASFVIGVLVTEVLRLLRERQRQDLSCPDKRLHALAKADKESIKTKVRIAWILYRPHFDGKEPYIDFIFGIFNNSLYDIVIDNSIKKGDIWCDSSSDPFYYDPKFHPAHPIACGSRRPTNFVIRHALRVEEVSRFEGKHNVLIGFGNLEITFAGTEEFPEIELTQLDLNYYLETKTGAWHNPNETEEFAFMYTDEQWAVIQSGNAAHSIELEELRAKLKDKDTAALANSPPAEPPPPELRCDDQQFYDVTMKDDYYVKAGSFDRRYRINKAAFADFKLKYDDATGESIDLRAEIVFRNESGETFHVRDGVWDRRQSKKVPLRYGETQSLILTAFDEDGVFYTYENQHPHSKPITVPMNGSVFNAEVIVTREYRGKILPPVRWYFLLSATAEREPAIKQIDTAGMQREPDADVV